MTRVYIPITLGALARAQEHGSLQGDAPEHALAAHAVTGAVREWYVEGDTEELEYSALSDAAEASLGLLAAESATARRRVVVAVDVEPERLTPSGGRFRSSVRIAGPIVLAKVVSVHVDEVDSEAVIAEAVGALAAAADGDEDARFLLDEAEACDLLWYDISEIDDLIG